MQATASLPLEIASLIGDLFPVMCPQQHVPATLYLRERHGNDFKVGRVGPRAVLDRWNISSPSGFDPGPSSP